LGRSAMAAKAVVKAIRTSARLVEKYPKIGRASDIEGVRVLSVVKYPYLVYYMIRPDEVVIAHVRHGAREAPRPGEV
jgi:toxin ParE1/3/4